MYSPTFADRHPVVLAVFTLDVLFVLVAAELAHYCRFFDLVNSTRYEILMAFMGLLYPITALLSGVYGSWRGKSAYKMLVSLFTVWLTAWGIVLTVLVFLQHAELFSRQWLALWFIFGFVLTAGFRFSVYKFLMHFRKAGRNSKAILFVGDPAVCEAVADKLEQNPGYGLKRQGIFALDTEIEQLSGQIKKSLLQTIDSASPHEIWLCLPLCQSRLIEPLMYALRNVTADIRFLPRGEDLRLLNHRSSVIADFQAIDLSCSPLSGSLAVIKRIEDLVLGTLITLIILPFCLLIAIAIKLTSSGPIVFKQIRNGLGGEKIKVYKFRSMHVHKENAGVVTQATKNDNRLTPIGAQLRRTSLDELPQFWNVLQGRMSIVGPRPHALAHNQYYEELVESYMRRHKVKPGITGWAQVNGYRGETDTLEKMQKRVELDLWYIDNWSLWLDIKIIFLTIFKGFINKNAY